SARNHVEGNLIGTDHTGTIALPDPLFTRDGISIGGTSPANANVIGGTAAGAGNVIAGVPAAGIRIKGNDNVVQGNLIGVDASGTQALGNTFDGIIVDLDASNNLIGGTAP